MPDVCRRLGISQRLDIYAAVDLTRLVQTAGITIEELAAMAAAGTSRGLRRSKRKG